MKNFLLEIGTEELPSGYIEPALLGLSSLLTHHLQSSRIPFGQVHVFGTPKRLALRITDLADNQDAIVHRIMGPPEQISFDVHGTPTLAAQKFADRVGIPVQSLQLMNTEKGRYVFAEKSETGQPTTQILQQCLPELIQKIPFPKTMKWATLSIMFARPIISILALHGETLIPFQLGNISSDQFTFGHRFMKHGKCLVSNADDYEQVLGSAFVIADIPTRKQMIATEIEKLARDTGGTVLSDLPLLDTVTHLVEYPVVGRGRFHTDYLELPKEVLITAMREHQRYFAVIDNKQELLPNFIVVNNTQATDMAVVIHGHERVLKARLSDAMFFYQADVNTSFDTWVSQLKGVLFQAQLGSMYEKQQRVQQIGDYLCNQINVNQHIKANVLRAACIYKADLQSQMVYEFPKLQGIMGRIYAFKANESSEVAQAIEEHYRPVFSGGALPESLCGAMLAIADKMDTLCGCFSVDLMPTGTSDPYALRRHTIGLIQIILNQGFSFSLTQLVHVALSLFIPDTTPVFETKKQQVIDFIKGRIVFLLEEQGLAKDMVQAVTAVSIEPVPLVFEKVKALEYVKSNLDFASLAIVFKRVVNIIKKEPVQKEISIDPSLFMNPCETNLYQAFCQVKGSVVEMIQHNNLVESLMRMASLKEPIDIFFNEVLVMTDDLAIRNNRLCLLQMISELFECIADFSKIST
ncbi:MAG: glycine--tRNA ligase subunit beta [Desulfobacterales bacterium]|nr:glycine--tRNA ligase subunit beta [Desulfobacterales bacterium]